MFVLRHQNSDALSYYGNNQLTFYSFKLSWFLLAINKGDIKDTEMEEIMNSIVDSLFSVFVTAGKCALLNVTRMCCSNCQYKTQLYVREHL